MVPFGGLCRLRPSPAVEAGLPASTNGVPKSGEPDLGRRGQTAKRSGWGPVNAELDLQTFISGSTRPLLPTFSGLTGPLLPRCARGCPPPWQGEDHPPPRSRHDPGRVPCPAPPSPPPLVAALEAARRIWLWRVGRPAAVPLSGLFSPCRGAISSMSTMSSRAIRSRRACMRSSPAAFLAGGLLTALAAVPPLGASRLYWLLPGRRLRDDARGRRDGAAPPRYRCGPAAAVRRPASRRCRGCLRPSASAASSCR